jgi:hypothetical protein
VPPSPARPPALVGRVFRGSTVVASGQLTRHQLQSSAWRRLFPDVYACSTLPITHELRTFAVTHVLLPGAVASGRSAAGLWDAELAGPDDPVECTVPARSRRGDVEGVHLTRRALDPAQVTRRRGIPVTDPIRTALDLARIRPEDDAVIALDRFLERGIVLPHELRAAATTLAGRGCRQVRAAAELADGLAGSPQETRLRLLFRREGLPAPVAQYTVYDDGRRLGRVDFAWPDRKLVVEYEGQWHGQHQQVGVDRRRLNALTGAGWTVVFVTAADRELGLPRSA